MTRRLKCEEKIMVPMWKHVCLRCGYIWRSEKRTPLTCAKCRNPGWRRKK